MQDPVAESELLSFTACVGETLAGFDTLPEALKKCAQAMVQYLGAACAGIWTWNPDQQSWQLLGSHCMNHPAEEPHSCMTLEHFNVARIAEEHSPHLSHNLAEDPCIDDKSWVCKEGMVSFAAHPLAVGNRLVGIMCMFARQPLPGDTTVALSAVANCVALGIERRKQEEKLLESQRNLADFFENSVMPLHTIDAAGKILAANKADLAMLGYSSAEFIGHNIAEFHVDQAALEDIMQRIAANENVEDYEARLRCKDGSIKHVLIDSNALFRDDHLVHTRCFARDITRRKEAEEKLLQSERRFRAVFDHTFEFIGLMNPDGTLIEANKTALNFIGMEAKDVLGCPFWDTPWWTHNKPLQELLKKAVSQAATGQLVRFEADHCDAEGRAITVDFSLKPVKDDAGKVILLIPEGRDISERKRAELKLLEVERDFRQLADNIREVFWISSPGGTRHFYVSPAYETIWGRPCQELYDHPERWFDAILPEDAEKVREHLQQQMSSSHPQPNEDEYRIRRPDGTIRWVWARVSPVLNENGLVTRVCGIAHDVTERKEVERRVSEFYSMVSHELRTPLTSIRAALGLIEGGVAGVVEPDTLELVLIARAESDRLIRLINDILDIRKIEAGRLELKVEQLDPGLLVTQTLDAIRGIAQEAEISLLSEISVSGKVVADGDRIVQVLTNLISNAIKFSPGGSQVTVKVAPGPDNSMVRFSVQDNGPGIPESKINRLFGLFQQLDSSDTRAKGGTGLGLAISKALVERHKGRIGVYSTIGQGTTSWFELPLVCPASNAEAPLHHLPELRQSKTVHATIEPPPATELPPTNRASDLAALLAELSLTIDTMEAQHNLAPLLAKARDLVCRVKDEQASFSDSQLESGLTQIEARLLALESSTEQLANLGKITRALRQAQSVGTIQESPRGIS